MQEAQPYDTHGHALPNQDGYQILTIVRSGISALSTSSRWLSELLAVSRKLPVDAILRQPWLALDTLPSPR